MSKDIKISRRAVSITFLIAVLIALQPPIIPAADTFADAPAWPHSQSDLTPDPSITWGKLDNGVRYALRPHAEPPERISLRLYVNAGSRMEDEHERGLAHFLEHMAFNGTENFEPGEMVKYFQRLGMAFGADTNAYTGFDLTVYQIELPEVDEALIDTGLLLLRDYADRMLLEKDEIDGERGIILSEKRTRDTVDHRTFKARIKFLLPNSILPKRMPIGVEEVIRNSTRADFVNFYRKWYTPSRTTIVAVGDLNEERFAELIAHHFEDMQEPDTLVAPPDLGEVMADGNRTGYHHESEAAATTVAIQTVAPYTLGPDTRERRIHAIQRRMAHAIITRRLDLLAREQDAPFAEGFAYAYDWLDFASLAAVELECEPDQWETALKIAENELRRAFEYGFTQPEIDYQAARLLTSYERAVETAPTRQSRELAEGVVRTLNAGNVYTEPQHNLEIAREALDKATPERLLNVFRSTWNKEAGRLLFVTGNLELDEKTAIQQINDVYTDSRAGTIEPPETLALDEFAYTEFGEPGRVIEKTTIEELDIMQLTLSNNVYVNLKPTEFEADTIQIGIRVGGGDLTATQKQPGLGILADYAFIQGGLEKHSYTDIENLFADKSVSLNFSVDSDAFVLSGTTNPTDLKYQLQLLAAYLIAPGYRPESLGQARQVIRQQYRRLRHTPGGVYQNQLMNFLASGDFRFGYPPEEDVLELTMDDLRPWLSEPLQNSLLEVSIVGDFDPDKLIDLLTRTFGAIPERAAEKPAYEEARQVQFPTDDKEQTFQYETEIPKAMVCVFWPTTDLWDITRSRQLNILSRVLRDRLRVKVREGIGETYSPSAFSYTSDTFKDYGYIAAIIETDPGKAEMIAELVQSIGDDLHEQGTTEDEIVRAVNPTLTGLRNQMRSNSYWLRTVLMGSTERPERLEWPKNIQAEFAAISREDVNSMAREYLHPDRNLKVFILPAPHDGPDLD